MSNDTVETIQPRLQKWSHQKRDGNWSIPYRLKATGWNGKRFNSVRLSQDLTTARKLLRKWEVENDNHFDWDAEEAKRKAEAQRIAAEEQKQLEAKRALENRMTVAKWLPTALEILRSERIKKGRHKGQLRRAGTFRNRKQDFAQISRILGSVYLDELSQEHLNFYVSKRKGEHSHRRAKSTGNNVADGTVRNECASFGTAIALARKIYPNIKPLNFNEAAPSAHSRSRVLNDLESKKYFDAAKATPWFYRYAYVASKTGIGLQDLALLRDSNIHEEGHYIKLRRIKTSEFQVAPLWPEVLQVINDLRAERIPGKVYELDPLVFRRDNGRSINGAAVNRAHREVCKVAGIANFQFRDFRHVAATAWARAGIAPQQACKAMGWSSPAMLKVYVDLAEKDVAAAFGLGQCQTKVKRTAPTRKKL